MYTTKEIPTLEHLNTFLAVNDAVLIDLRNKQEYERDHLTKAINVSLVSDAFIPYMIRLDKKQNVVLYCTDGSRSKVASKILTDYGFTNLYNVKNGLNE